MADALVAALTQDQTPADIQSLWLTEPLGIVGGITGAMFSGGVSEYVYGREERDFGDLGRRLGHAIRERLDTGRFQFPLLPSRPPFGVTSSVSISSRAMRRSRWHCAGAGHRPTLASPRLPAGSSRPSR